MSATLHMLVQADSKDDLAEMIGELMISLNARYGDNSEDTCERVLGWLRVGGEADTT